MRPIHLLALAALLLGAPDKSPAQAQQPVLVELFTSQGCSSCPPADDLLRELGLRDDVVALAYHVDYWDYLGWQDTFGQKVFSERQESYSPRVDRQYIGRKLRGSFTPEIIIQGTDSLIGSTRNKIISRIEAHASTPRVAAISLRQDGTDLVVELEPVAARLPDTRIMLARYIPEASVAVEQGENAGQELSYSNVVTSLRMIGTWKGNAPMRLRVADTTGPVAVFLQRGKAGPILAAAEME